MVLRHSRFGVFDDDDNKQLPSPKEVDEICELFRDSPRTQIIVKGPCAGYSIREIFELKKYYEEYLK